MNDNRTPTPPFPVRIRNYDAVPYGTFVVFGKDRFASFEYRYGDSGQERFARDAACALARALTEVAS